MVNGKQRLLTRDEAHSMLEAVCRAICIANNEDPDAIEDAGDFVLVPVWKGYIEMAVAAVDALMRTQDRIFGH